MARLAIGIILLSLLTSVTESMAESSDLSAGVLIAHHPLGLVYSSGDEWCERYSNESAIRYCKDQNNRIDEDGSAGIASVWFVLAAWTESKDFCGYEFGLDAYESGSYSFVEWGPCFSGVGLELPSADWPGSESGTALAVVSDPWSGNLVPLYYFVGYAYSEEVISLGINPDSGSGRVGNCDAELFPFADYGAMGLFTDGVAVCPTSTGPGSGLRAERRQEDAKDVLTARAEMRKRPAVKRFLGTVHEIKMLEERDAEGHTSHDAASTSDQPTLSIVPSLPGSRIDIDFTLGNATTVHLGVYDSTGRLISTIHNGLLELGTHRKSWDCIGSNGSRVSSGMYFIRLEIAGDGVNVQRTIILH